jgi:hypothetical protein
MTTPTGHDGEPLEHVDPLGVGAADDGVHPLYRCRRLMFPPQLCVTLPA